MFRSRSCCYRERKREGGTKVPTLSFLETGSGTWSSGTCQVPRASTHFSHMVELYTALQNQKEQTYFIGYFILTTGHHLTPDTTTQYARMRVSLHATSFPILSNSREGWPHLERATPALPPPPPRPRPRPPPRPPPRAAATRPAPPPRTARLLVVAAAAQRVHVAHVLLHHGARRDEVEVLDLRGCRGTGVGVGVGIGVLG